MANKFSDIVAKMKKKSNTIKSYQKVFNTLDGKKVLEDLNRSCFLTQSTFTGDTHDSAFNEGQRAVLLRIYSILKTQPEKLMEDIIKYEESANEI